MIEYIKPISLKKALYRTKNGYKIKRVTDKTKPIVLSKDENTLYKRYKYSAEERDYTFDLSTDTFKRLIYSNCYFCGIKPKQIQGEILYNGIDRLDNDLGYSIKNCLACCKVCNRGKSTMNSDDFLSYTIRIATMLYPQMIAFKEGDLELVKKLRDQHMVDSGVIQWK